MTNEPLLLPCVSCGYDLRGLDPDGVCPECAASIRRSLDGDRIANADPAWLATIIRGQRMVSLGVKFMAFGFLASLGLMFIFAAVLNLGGPWELVYMTCVVLAVLGGLVIACGGTFLVTASDPRDAPRERRVSLRVVARWSMTAAPLLFVLGQFGRIASDRTLMLLGAALAFTAMVAFAVGLVTVLFRMAQLADRIPDPELADRIRGTASFFRWGLPVMFVFSFVTRSGFVRTAGGAGTSVIETFAAVLGCISLVVIIGILIHVARLVQSMGALSRALRDAAGPGPGDETTPA